MEISSSERWQRVEEVLDAALDLPPERRAAFLDRTCDGDPELYAEVKRMLSCCAQAEDFLEEPAAEFAAPLLADLAESPEGKHVGPYRIVREIGRGGMGAVYLAERDDDQFHQRVALKLVHYGIDPDDHVVRRFLEERQILASLEHPNIARLLGGGVTEPAPGQPGDGMPYFVMEYVEGTPIDRYCDEHRLPIDARLNLFRKVCRAVQYAHRNLIVHRDLKPSNILVSRDGAVKLLDFGIAKLLTRGDEAGAPALTRWGIRPMTPAFASPEQVRGEAASPASDVYALGLVLYQLLTGRNPQSPEGRSPGEIERAICELLPEYPSEVIIRTGEITRPDGSTRRYAPEEVSRARDTRPERLRRRLSGDLDTITVMALRKEPERRYASVEQLSEDLRRHLAGLPVIARKDTARYRAAKFIQRHAVGVVAATLIGLTLLGGIAGTTWQARVAAAERDRARMEAGIAEREAEKAQRISTFLIDLFEVADPGEARGNSITAREILDAGAEKITAGLGEQPEVRAALMDVMGRVYQNLGLYDEATPLLKQALALRRGMPGDAEASVAESLYGLGRLLLAKGEYDRAESLLLESLDIRRGLFDGASPEVAETLNDLARVLQAKGEYDTADSLFRRSLAIYEEATGARSSEVATVSNNLAALLHRRGAYEKAEPLYRRALALKRELLGKNHPEVATALNNLAALLFAHGAYDEAETLFREVLAIKRKLLGDTHPSIGLGLNNLGSLQLRKGDYRTGERLYREALLIFKKSYEDEHPYIAITTYNLAASLHRQQKLAVAERLYREAIERTRAAFPPRHPRIAVALVGLGELWLDRGSPQRAEPLLREGLSTLRAAFPEDHPQVAKAQRLLDACRTVQNRGAPQPAG